MIRWVVLIQLLVSYILLTNSSHLRFGSVEWYKQRDFALNVTITVKLVQRKGWFDLLPIPQPISVGEGVYDDILDYGDGGDYTYNYVLFHIMEINLIEDYVVLEYTETHTYPAPGYYNIKYGSCCRLTGTLPPILNNNAGKAYNYASAVNIDQAEIEQSYINDAPVSSMVPIIYIPEGIANFTYRVVASDPDGDPVAFRMADPLEMGDPTSTQPPGMTCTPDGYITISDPLGPGLWSTVQVVTDPSGAYILVDYLLYVKVDLNYCNGHCGANMYTNTTCRVDTDCHSCNSTCLKASPRLIFDGIDSPNFPRTDHPTPTNGAIINVNAGDTIYLDYVADDENLVDPVPPVQIYSTFIPPGAYFSDQVECNVTNGCSCIGCNAPQLRTFQWTPSIIGTATWCIGVSSQSNHLSYAQHCITIIIVDAYYEITSQELTTSPLTTKALTTSFVTSYEMTTHDWTTRDVTTKFLTTKPLSTKPLSTSPLSTQPLTTKPLTTKPLSTKPLTTAPLTTKPLTTGITTKPLSTGAISTGAVTSHQMTSAKLTSAKLTTYKVTTSKVTSGLRPTPTTGITLAPPITSGFVSSDTTGTTEDSTGVTGATGATGTVTGSTGTSDDNSDDQTPTGDQSTTGTGQLTGDSSTGDQSTGPTSTGSTGGVSTTTTSGVMLTSGFMTTDAVTIIIENTTVTVTGPPRNDSDCSFCGNKNYVCSNETSWGDGSFNFTDPRLGKQNYTIVSVDVEIVRLVWCGARAQSFDVSIEEVFMGEGQTNNELPCICDDCSTVTLGTVVSGVFFSNYSTPGSINQIVITTDEVICISSFRISFGLTLPKSISLTTATDREEIKTSTSSPTANRKASFSPFNWLYIAIAILVLALLLVLLLVLWRRNKRTDKNQADLELTAAAIPLDDETDYRKLPEERGTNYHGIPNSKREIGDGTDYKVLPENNQALASRSNDAASDFGEFLPKNKYSWVIDPNEVIIEKEIGRGAFGIVFKADWRKISVAVKQLINSSGGEIDRKQMDDFAQEIQLMMSLRNHQNVVMLYGITINPLTIITEFLENGSLWDYLQKDVEIPAERRNMIIHGIAKGMLHLHKENIIHRDLAARNVLLTGHFEPKISDFGLSRVNNEQGNVTKSDVGPLKWMAPECIKSQQYSIKSDVWSYGITVIEVLTRKLPYGDRDAVKVAAMVMYGEMKPTSEVPADAPLELKLVLEKCFEFNEVERPDMDWICDRLNEYHY